MTNHISESEASLDRLFTRLAKKHLDIETLVVRNLDRLDFYDVSVWGVKLALQKAYKAGLVAGRSQPSAKP